MRKVPLVLVRLAPLRTRNHDETVEGAAARRRRRRRVLGAVAMPLLVLLVAGGVAAAVLTGAATRGDASVLLGAVAVAGLAEFLRRRLRRDAGTADTPTTSVLTEDRYPQPMGGHAPEPAETVVFTGVWSARGAIRGDVRRVPPTRCALPPEPGTAAAQAQTHTETASEVEVIEPAPNVASAEDIDLTREVLAALHAGSEA